MPLIGTNGREMTSTNLNDATWGQPRDWPPAFPLALHPARRKCGGMGKGSVSPECIMTAIRARHIVKTFNSDLPENGWPPPLSPGLRGRHSPKEHPDCCCVFFYCRNVRELHADSLHGEWILNSKRHDSAEVVVVLPQRTALVLQCGWRARRQDTRIYLFWYTFPLSNVTGVCK